MAFLPKPGQSFSGFTVTGTYHIHTLEAQALELCHKQSGACIFYIQTQDNELGFNLIYRTPQLDQMDTNHILEHLLLCSSKRYPSRDIFFDMDSKSYSTFLNGITDNTYTSYPICTQSQKQLVKLMDVLLSCMEEPEGLYDKNFFLREAVRFELEEPQGELSLSGTVFNEDWGYLTDLEEQADFHLAQTLYPGQTASNLLGQAHFHYQELSFKHVKHRFSQLYDYSNCLMVLYGDMDIGSVLSFLHQRHLSYFQSRQLNLMSYFKEPVLKGFREAAAQCPAYENSSNKDSSILDYAIDLSESTQEELIYWDLFAGLFDHDASIWKKTAQKAGLNCQLEAGLDTQMAKPILKFRLCHGNPEQKDTFLRSICCTLTEISKSGIPAELLIASVKEKRLSDCLIKGTPHMGLYVSEELAKYWSLTGKTDYFTLYEYAFEQFAADKGQSIIKHLAEKCLTPGACAFVATTPVPGLAEKLEHAKAAFLKERKSAFTSAEIQALCSETKAFKQWNSQNKTNSDFLISPSELPAPQCPPPFSFQRIEGITFYCSPVPIPQAGCYEICFDISSIPPDSWNYLVLYQLLLTELPTKRYTAQQQKTLEQEYLHDCIIDEHYPDHRAGANSHPLLSVSWRGLTCDFEKSLDFLLEIMGESDYEDIVTIQQILDQYLPDYDMSQSDHAPSLAYSLAENYIRQENRFRYMLNSPEIYTFLKKLKLQLKEDPEQALVVSRTLRMIAKCIVHKKNLIFMASAALDSLEQIEYVALKYLKSLPGPPAAFPVPGNYMAGSLNTHLPLPPIKQKTAACVDSPSQEIRVLGDFLSCPDFKGRYLPYLLAAGDQYVKPSVRYQGEAYDSGIDFSLAEGYFTLWSTADSRVASTIQIFLSAGRELGRLKISQQDLNGYILKAYANALAPDGLLNRHMRSMRRHMRGIDTEALDQMISDIRNSSLEDQSQAACIIDKMLQNGPVSVVGNKKAILEHAELFDQILYIGNE